MTTPAVDPQPRDDMEDPDAGGVAPADAPGKDGEESDDTDAMGIDDDDPIDATLVGSPVDDDDTADQQGASTQPAGEGVGDSGA